MSTESNLNEAIEQIHKTYGKGSLLVMSNHKAAEPIESISSGSKAIDGLTGIDGFAPRGRITEIYGPEASGKSTLAQQIMAQAQKMGGVVAYIDAEHCLDLEYARALGVNTEAMLLSQPDDGESALEIALTLVKSGGIMAIVIDSVAALVPRAELEGDMGDSMMGLQARLMSQAMRKLVAAVKTSGTAMIFINQIREKIGIMFGNPETTTGGRALKFYSSIRAEVRRISQIKKKDIVVGANTKIKIVKNKFAPPFRDIEVPLIYGKGFSE